MWLHQSRSLRPQHLVNHHLLVFLRKITRITIVLKVERVLVEEVFVLLNGSKLIAHVVFL
jgi:hypothetical protein